MPNAGIQSYRSTNWKSADVASNWAHSSSVCAKTSADTMSATWRMRGSFSGVSFRNSSASAPAIGTPMSVLRMGNVISTGSTPG